MPQAPQSFVSKVVWVVMAGLVLACLAMGSELWKLSAATAEPEEEAKFTAADVHAAVTAARQQARGQQDQAPVKPMAVTTERTPQPGNADNSTSPPLQLLHRLDTPVMPDQVASGRDGLAMLVNQRALRPASPGDLQGWLQRAREKQVGALNEEAVARMSHYPAYVITGPVRIPDGLTGADLALFLMDSRSPYPVGRLGHSALLDMETGGCNGAACAMLFR